MGRVGRESGAEGFEQLRQLGKVSSHVAGLMGVRTRLQANAAPERLGDDPRGGKG